ncbi:MAG: EF-P lysine aminoacylase GenX [Legionellales bacterium RIFCSPHIGHO2_12_FULL_35_11]|nr:MAG: EF-P lysine aminoacylase GenX [Legionellales bacterium RIFCSPHIGHO2_12_FULL_35_11]
MIENVNWQPSATIADLQKRSKIISLIRSFFVKMGYLEVETPIMAKYGITDIYLRNIKANFLGESYCLQTSPEYHMKRLLAAGSGPIFQIARSFRGDELGRWHNPEFSLLEWYQLDYDHHQLLAEVDLFLQETINSPPLIKLSYQEAFLKACDVDPFTASIKDFQSLLAEYGLNGVLPSDEEDIDQYLFLIMSHIVEPYFANIDAPIGVYNFPKSQSALAKVVKDVALRFEVYYKGIELANGFCELTAYEIQAERFASDISIRKERNLDDASADKYLLSALKSGMPECSGVALGIDRLIAIFLEKENISSTLAFDISIA